MHSFEIQINVCKQFCIYCLSCTHYPVSLFDRRKRKYSMTSTKICIILDKMISWICLAATNTLPFDKKLHHIRYRDFMNICVASYHHRHFHSNHFEILKMKPSLRMVFLLLSNLFLFPAVEARNQTQDKEWGWLLPVWIPGRRWRKLPRPHSTRGHSHQF